MTAKEKATDMVESFRVKILTQHSAWNVMTENSFPMPLKFVQKSAIQCALIAVADIIDAVKQIIGDERHMWTEHQLGEILYWESVKIEIADI